MNKNLLMSIGIVALVCTFIGVNIVAQRALSGVRVDLTQGRLYTLSDGTRNVLAGLKEPVNLTLYYSAAASSDVPTFKAYAQRVVEVLREYAQVSGGNIRLTIANPEPFSDTEDKAVAAGVVGLPLGRGQERFYFGLHAVNSTDKADVIPFFDPRREDFLEYDLTRMIYLLSEPKRTTIGVMSWIPLEGSPASPMTSSRGTPPMRINEQLKELFDVRVIDREAREIPADVNVLLVVHPKNPVVATQYAIDQFVMRGGRLLLLVDPLCEVDVPAGMNPMQAMNTPRSSDLNLLSTLGLELVPGKVAADRQRALPVTVGSQARPEQVDFVAWLSLGSDQADRNDPVTGQIENLNLATAGILRIKEGAKTTITPLLKTTADSMAIDAQQLAFMPDPKALLATFKSGGEPLILAARVTGSAVPSTFGAAPPVLAPGADGRAPEPLPVDRHLASSKGDINVIVIADVDLLSDRLWVQEERLGPILLGYRKAADNGETIIGALDNLGGSSDLLSLRARTRAARPFSRVEQLRRDAEQQFLQREQELQARLTQTEQKIAELQRSRADGQSSLILTPEQQAELEAARQAQITTRAELRDVQFQLRKDIEGLGTRIKAVNILLVPALVGVAALALAGVRAARRRGERLRASATG